MEPKTIIKMIDSNGMKSIIMAIVSIFSYAMSQVSGLIADMGFVIELGFMPMVIEEGVIDIILERGARTIAIAAGLVAIVNGFQFSMRKNKNKTDESEQD